MKNLQAKILIIFLVCLLCIAGCVAPPKSNASSSSSTPWSSQSDNGQSVETGTTIPSYVMIETPYQTTTSGSFPRTYLPVATPTPDDYIQIYSTTQSFGWNITAVSFNLAKPPMIIDFAVIPVNITGTKVITSKIRSKADETISYDYISPYSWFEISVREKTTGKILNKDGFGTYKQYSDDTGKDVPRRLKIMQPGNLLIEMSGNQITATVNISVIKTGNIIT